MTVLLLLSALVPAHPITGLRSWLRRRAGDGGQTTAEYALVLLGAATVALVLVAWATRTGKIAELFDAVVDGIISKL